MSTYTNNIRKVLQESGRYEEVKLRLVNKIYGLKDDVTYPVYNGDSICGQNIVKGLSIIYNVIRSADSMSEISSAAYDEQFVSDAIAYIDSENRMKLNNYAITISHRRSIFENSMENIRVGLIIDHIAHHVIEAIHSYNEDIENARKVIDEFYIPDGWKRIITNENTTVKETLIESVQISADEALDNIIKQLQTLRETSELHNIPIITSQQEITLL